jgi:hypothetical protein
MIEESDPIIRTAERLCETLERIGDALVAIDADALLETQETLEQLLATLSTATSVQDQPALAAVVRRSIDALTRCRQLALVFGNCGNPAALRPGSKHTAATGAACNPPYRERP